MNYISVCSGIEAASQAWEPLGWNPLAFSEIEKFPSNVLTHHWPDVPNLGDMNNFLNWPYQFMEQCDVLVGGCPCQAFSVAGLRNSLSDDRGNLTLTFVQLANYIDFTRIFHGKQPVTIVYENVPGILSTKDNAFGCFLAALVGEEVALEPPGGKWTNSGRVSGPQRSAAWRILDAQYFGVAQRRRRVFVVASAREGFDPGAILFESEGVRRDTAPSREAGQSFTHDVAPSLTSSGRGVERGGDTRGQDPVVATVSTQKWPAEIAPTLNAHFGEKQGLEDQHINDGGGLFVPHVMSQYGDVAGALTARHDSSPCADRGMNMIAIPLQEVGKRTGAPNGSAGHGQRSGDSRDERTLRSHQSGGYEGARVAYVAQVSPTLRAGGNATGGDRPVGTDVDTVETLVCCFGGNNTSGPIEAAAAVNAKGGQTARHDSSPCADRGMNVIAIPLQNATRGKSQNGLGIGGANDPMFTLDQGSQHAVAATPCYPINTLTLGGRPDPVNDARMTLGIGADGDPQFTLQANHSYAVAFAENSRAEIRLEGGDGFEGSVLTPQLTVRRLTPRECERLQGMADDHTAIPGAADGPRYKAIGNSKAVPVVRWLGRRIARYVRGVV